MAFGMAIGTVLGMGAGAWTQRAATALAGRLTMAMMATAMVVVVLGGGCAGSSSATGASGRSKLPPEALDPSPVAESDQAIAGTSFRCQGQGQGTTLCACRPIDEYGLGEGPAADAEDPPPPPGRKRFELRTGRGHDEYRITVEGLGTIRKSGEDPEPACIYVDLPEGARRVRYHVVAREPAAGLEARLRVSEYSPRWKRWYRTFAYRCGTGSGPCTKDDARDALVTPGVKAGKYDPCGSTRVQGLRFFTDQPADAAVTDFNLQLVLNVYRFAPRFPPGAKRCTGVSYEADDASSPPQDPNREDAPAGDPGDSGSQ
jgi:hypothetical protein